MQDTREPIQAGSYLAEFMASWAPGCAIKPDAPVADPDIKAMVRQQRMTRFKELCPARFCEPIKRELIPNLKAWDEADKWTGDFMGLFLWSHETGHAKTRMLWRQFGRIHVEQGRTCLCITGQALAEEYFEYHMAGESRGFYRWVLRHSVVMLDDVDKCSLEDARSARMLRELLDELYKHKTPVLITANEPMAYFDQCLGHSAARRLQDVAREIHF